VTKSFPLLTAEVGLDEDTPNKAPRPALPDMLPGTAPTVPPTEARRSKDAPQSSRKSMYRTDNCYPPGILTIFISIAEK
jgi:hypothetical protein